jgi:hypothetical protein
MDFSRLKTPDWLVIGGGLAVLIFGFIDWFKVGLTGEERDALEAAGLSTDAPGANGFDFVLTGLIPWILIVGAAVVMFLLATGMMKAGSAPWTMIILGATALGALLIILRLLIGADASDVFSNVPSDQDRSLDRSAGLWLSALGAIAAAAGGFLGFQAAGGNVRDLTDIDKMKAAFKS